MKKVLTLGFLLAIVAILALPMAALAATGTTSIGGAVVAGTISVAPPSAIAFGTLKVADQPITKSSVTPGKVTVTPGSSGADAWGLDVQSTTGIYPGYLTSGGTKLTYVLLIAKTDASPWYKADGSTGTTPVGPTGSQTTPVSGILKWAGNGTTSGITLAGRQHLDVNDDVAGAYTCVLTFTATLTTP